MGLNDTTTGRNAAKTIRDNDEHFKGIGVEKIESTRKKPLKLSNKRDSKGKISKNYVT